MLISEILSTVLDYTEREFGDEDLYRATFIAGDRTIVVDIAKVPRAGKHYEITFEEKKAGKPGSLGITGSGEEFKVFGTVVAIVQRFMEAKNIDSISFTAEKSDGNRAKLYQKMVNRIAKGKWQQETDHAASDYRSYFTIKRTADKA